MTPTLSRRHFLRRSAMLTVALPLGARHSFAAEKSAPIVVGSRLELFVDDFLVDRFRGKAELRLHHPEPREVVMTWDQPWEGNVSSYPNNPILVGDQPWEARIVEAHGRPVCYDPAAREWKLYYVTWKPSAEHAFRQRYLACVAMRWWSPPLRSCTCRPL